ncbi:MAG TPA: hypothetical protein VMT43_06530, partial [Acidimicrobiales bacterium]|nr:hypothetical protein [Acidimicrobiales bacterium]
HTFAGVPTPEVRAMLGGTAAGVYGFNLGALGPIAKRYGPSVDQVSAGLDDLPDSESLAFEARSGSVA